MSSTQGTDREELPEWDVLNGLNGSAPRCVADEGSALKGNVEGVSSSPRAAVAARGCLGVVPFEKYLLEHSGVPTWISTPAKLAYPGSLSHQVCKQKAHDWTWCVPGIHQLVVWVGIDKKNKLNAKSNAEHPHMPRGSACRQDDGAGGSYEASSVRRPSCSRGRGVKSTKAQSRSR